METNPILKMDRHLWIPSRFQFRSSYKKRYSVSIAIGVYIHSLILSFIHSIRISQSPHLMSSHMKQENNKLSPSAQLHADARPTRNGVRPCSAKDVQWY